MWQDQSQSRQNFFWKADRANDPVIGGVSNSGDNEDSSFFFFFSSKLEDLLYSVATHISAMTFSSFLKVLSMIDSDLKY